MDSNIKMQLKEAKKLYGLKNYDESLNLFEQLFNESPESFDFNYRISYCWAIYQVRVKDFTDIDELYDAVDFITELVPQVDLNMVNTCPYTFSVFKVLDFLYDEHEYYNIFDWLDRIDPRLLDENSNGRNGRSRKEKYYVYASKSYLECAEWESCIETSKEALATLKRFTNNGDIWHRWWIAKSLKEVSQSREALSYLEEVIKVKGEWFVFKEFSENYYLLGESEKALEYIPGAVLTNDSIKMKVNLYALIFNLLKDSDYDMAFKHAQMHCLLKSQSNSEVSDDIKDLEIDEDELDKNKLLKEIDRYWNDFKFKDKKLEYGTVTKFFDDRNFGFIADDDDESIFFHRDEFEGDYVYVGQLVSFYRQNSFDKSKNRESLKAVSVRGE